MRLIDADALLKAMSNETSVYFTAYVDLVKNAPTVQREGWVSVPIEPTPEMLRSMHVWIEFNEKSCDDMTKTYNEFSQVASCYKAMLSAAPKE